MWNAATKGAASKSKQKEQNTALGEKPTPALSGRFLLARITNNNVQSTGPVFLCTPPPFHFWSSSTCIITPHNHPIIKFLCTSRVWENRGKRKFDALPKAPQNWERTPVSDLQTRLSPLCLIFWSLPPKGFSRVWGSNFHGSQGSAQEIQR